MAKPCPFCDPAPEQVVFAGERALALVDSYPVSPGHALVVPKRHVASWFELAGEERLEMLELLDRLRASIIESRGARGFNIGINEGPVAGQTVPHVHVHLIPRYQGDQSDPRGGVRWIFPDRAAYWERK